MLELADASPISGVESFSAAKAPTTQADQLVPNPDQAARSTSAQPGFFDHDFDRSLKGSVIADFELASTRPLTSTPLLWCMSNTFTNLVKNHGEDLVCAMALKRGAEQYLRDIEAPEDMVNGLNSRFDHGIMREYDVAAHTEGEDQWAALVGNAGRFRKDRAFVWDVLERATRDYFNDYEDEELPVARKGARHSSANVRVVVKATRTLVARLCDAETSAYLKGYWIGEI